MPCRTLSGSPRVTRTGVSRRGDVMHVPSSFPHPTPTRQPRPLRKDDRLTPTDDPLVKGADSMVYRYHTQR
eukprot:5981370-Prymnesium_polylepis.1